MGLNEAMARRLEALRGRVALACARAGRPADAVSLVAVTKGVAPEQVIAACAAGLSQLGENRLQDAAERMAAVRAAGLRPCWHFIGHLQGNKVRGVVENFDTVDSVDSLALAERISTAALRLGRRLPVLIQVNAAGDPAKQGLSPEETPELAATIAGLPGLAVEGLMTIVLNTRDEGLLRPAFARMTALQERLRQAMPQHAWRRLSMGMSEDFELAVEMGATEIRLGRALFDGLPTEG
jgi:pyridoxal phosphate enzyme (YggS family)